MSALSFLDKEHSVARPGFSRWLVPPAALAIHLCIGQVYAFSVFKIPLVEKFDTSETAIAIVFSIAIVMLGLAAAFGGKWMERNGPRKAMFLSAVCFSAGLFVGGLGVATEQLWLLYLGYGVIGGIGLGIGYISPVSTLIKWFPDRPGLATGMAIMGFGGGAFIASALSSELLQAYTSVGEGEVPTDAVVPAFFTLGAVYLVFMMFGVFTIRIPPQGWRPDGWTPKENASNKMMTTANVSADNAIKTPQFWFLWTVLFCNVTAGIGILEQASPMIQDFFPDGVDAAAAAGFVGLLSLFNMADRFIWSSTSDVIGRKPTYMIYLGVGAVLFFFLATAGSSSVVDGDDVIERWNNGETPLLLAHPASAGHGLNLQKGGNIIVWFGLNWSLELYQQFNARLYRQGQTKPVIIHHIIVENSVDERVIASLGSKNVTQKDLLNALKKDIEARV